MGSRPARVTNYSPALAAPLSSTKQDLTGNQPRALGDPPRPPAREWELETGRPGREQLASLSTLLSGTKETRSLCGQFLARPAHLRCHPAGIPPQEHTAIRALALAREEQIFYPAAEH